MTDAVIAPSRDSAAVVRDFGVDDLADWFFDGYHAYQEPHHWTDL